MTSQLFTAGLIAIKDQQLLLAFSKNKQAWYLPGGKIDSNESPAEGLIREVREELQVELDLQKLQYYCHITAPAYGEMNNIIMEQSCYRHDLTEPIHPSSEIEKMAYFSSENYLQDPVKVQGVVEVFNRLSVDQLI